MKKLTALLALVLLMGTASLAKADVVVRAYGPTPYHHVYVPPRVAYRHWVPGRGWVVYRPVHRVLVWNRYHHCWM